MCLTETLLPPIHPPPNPKIEAIINLNMYGIILVLQRVTSFWPIYDEEKFLAVNLFGRFHLHILWTPVLIYKICAFNFCRRTKWIDFLSMGHPDRLLCLQIIMSKLICTSCYWLSYIAMWLSKPYNLNYLSGKGKGSSDGENISAANSKRSSLPVPKQVIWGDGQLHGCYILLASYRSICKYWKEQITFDVKVVHEGHTASMWYWRGPTLFLQINDWNILDIHR